ncbi:MAG: hypothetical protein MJ174_02810 [Treponema sp.]|nr:hypothetical protein [Treponema sp.]
MSAAKKYIITYKLPNSETIHRSTSINANSLIEARNKFKMGNPGKIIVSCVKVLG